MSWQIADISKGKKVTMDLIEELKDLKKQNVEKDKNI